MLMALHPHIQKRARAEVIDAVGIDQIPKAADISQFTYLLALMKEVFRFAPIGPLGESQRNHVLWAWSLI